VRDIIIEAGYANLQFLETGDGQNTKKLGRRYNATLDTDVRQGCNGIRVRLNDLWTCPSK
jgi:hypothetical protein